MRFPLDRCAAVQGGSKYQTVRIYRRRFLNDLGEEGQHMLIEQPNFNGGAGQSQPRNDTTLHTEHLQVERKSYSVFVKENARGRYLRIVEEVNHERRSQIIVPISGVGKLAEILKNLASYDEKPTST
jgi:hypothetical protein